MENAPTLVSELARFRDDRKTLSFRLVGGETVEGAIRWFDADAIHIVTPTREEITLFRSALLFFRPVR